MRVQPARTADGTVRVTAELRSPRRTGDGDDLWFEVDEATGEALTDRGDPFVLATLLLAMREGVDLRLSGRPVSTSLLRRLEEFQHVWHAWYGLPVVDLHAEAEDDDGPARAADAPAVVAFSGGVDSAFSAHRHVVAPASPRAPRVEAGLTIHGMDIPLSDPDGYEGAAARAARMLDSIGLAQVRVRSNAWDFLPDDEPGHFAALGVASALHLVAGRFGTGLVPSTMSYRELTVPADSSPVTDWMLASRGFDVVHDGASASRLEKLRRLGTWPEAMANLRVCLVDPRHDRNCGDCNKCLLTYVELLVLGIEPACFDPRPTPERVRRWARTFPSNPLYAREMRLVLDEATARRVDDRWVPIARAKLATVVAKDAVRGVAPGAVARFRTAHWRLGRRLRPGRS